MNTFCLHSGRRDLGYVWMTLKAKYIIEKKEKSNSHIIIHADKEEKKSISLCVHVSACMYVCMCVYVCVCVCV